MPDGKARIEPRCDIDANRKPPVPYPSIGWAPGKKPAYFGFVMRTLLDPLRAAWPPAPASLHPRLRGPRGRSRRGPPGVATQAEINQHRRTNKDGGIGRDEKAPD